MTRSLSKLNGLSSKNISVCLLQQEWVCVHISYWNITYCLLLLRPRFPFSLDLGEGAARSWQIILVNYIGINKPISHALFLRNQAIKPCNWAFKSFATVIRTQGVLDRSFRVFSSSTYCCTCGHSQYVNAVIPTSSIAYCLQLVSLRIIWYQALKVVKVK